MRVRNNIRARLRTPSQTYPTHCLIKDPFPWVIRSERPDEVR